MYMHYGTRHKVDDVRWCILAVVVTIIVLHIYMCVCVYIHTYIYAKLRSCLISCFKNKLLDFTSGAVVKNPPANSGDTGSSPGLGRPHMLWSNQAWAPQLLSLCSTAHEPQLLSPCSTTTEARAPTAHAPQQEKPPQWEVHALQRRVALARCN